MSDHLKEPEVLLLKLLRVSLGGEPDKDTLTSESAPVSFENVTRECMEEMLHLADIHAVLPLLYDSLEKNRGLPQTLWRKVENAARTTVRSNYRLLFLTKYVTGLLETNKIKAIVLKGVATASYYPVPELRKAGDIDILIPKMEDCRRASQLLLQNGFCMQEHQAALHHIEMQNDEGIRVEIHQTLVEPFENRSINAYLKALLPEYGEHCVVNTSWGISFYQPADAYHAFYLLLHMLQHFLRAGFGLKFLCDWVVFWNREVEEAHKQEFVRLVRESGTEGFARVLTETCVKYLGLKREHMDFLLGNREPENGTEDFCREVFRAGEFGRAQKNRMVAMRGSGIRFYVKEFHHQMRLNYPAAGRVPLTWPLLWILTFVRFLYNNHAVRNVSGREILKEAGRRSRLIQQMRLFERE